MFQVASNLSKITTMGDHSLRLQVDVSKELTAEENAKVFALYNKLGFFIFKEAEIMEEDLIDVPAYVKEFKDDKSPSQRQRAVMYLCWEKQMESKKIDADYNFNRFYADKMEEIINHFKKLLD